MRGENHDVNPRVSTLQSGEPRKLRCGTQTWWHRSLLSKEDIALDRSARGRSRPDQQPKLALPIQAWSAHGFSRSNEQTEHLA
jgi:hypothetical protein